jgi:hypothetical protein
MAGFLASDSRPVAEQRLALVHAWLLERPLGLARGDQLADATVVYQVAHEAVEFEGYRRDR